MTRILVALVAGACASMLAEAASEGVRMEISSALADSVVRARYQTAVQTMIDKDVLARIQAAARTSRNRTGPALVRVHVTDSSDPRAIGLQHKPEGRTLEISSGFVIVLDVGLDAAIIATRERRWSDLIAYLDYIQRRAGTPKSHRETDIQVTDTVSFESFIGLRHERLARIRADPDVISARVDLMQHSIAWIVAHAIAHQSALGSRTAAPLERAVDNQTAELLVKAGFTPIAPLPLAMLYAGIENSDDFNAEPALCRAAGMTEAGLTALRKHAGTKLRAKAKLSRAELRATEAQVAEWRKGARCK